MPNKEPVKYEYVGIEDPWMRFAYNQVKALYAVKGWNAKTTPVAVIVRNGTMLSHGVAGNGRHMMLGSCARLDKPGSSYKECEFCREEEHAEQYALRSLKWAKISPYGADLYLYGHYRMCEDCVSLAQKQGIKRFILMEDCDTLFDRHHPDTVIGKPEQFAL